MIGHCHGCGILEGETIRIKRKMFTVELAPSEARIWPDYQSRPLCQRCARKLLRHVVQAAKRGVPVEYLT